MPNSASAKKRLRQSVVRRDRNRAIKSLLRKRVRSVRDAVTAGNLELAEQEYRLAAKSLDRAGARNIIHSNTASRKKSRLQQMIRKAKQPAS